MSNRENHFSSFRAPRRPSPLQLNAPQLRPRVPPPIPAFSLQPIAPVTPALRPRNAPLVNPFLNLSPMNLSSANVPPSRPFMHQPLSLRPVNHSPRRPSRSIFNPQDHVSPPPNSFFNPQNLNPNLTTMNILQQQNPLSPVSRRAVERYSGFIRSRPRNPQP